MSLGWMARFERDDLGGFLGVRRRGENKGWVGEGCERVDRAVVRGECRTRGASGDMMNGRGRHGREDDAASQLCRDVEYGLALRQKNHL